MRWRVLAAASGEPLGEVELEGQAAVYRAAPGGEDWLALVEELVRGEDFTLRAADGSLVEGPHDRDPDRLEAALGLVARNYPHLAIETESGRRLGEAPAPAADVGVELERALVLDLLEEIAANIAPPPHAAQLALRRALEPLLGAESQAELGQALGALTALLDGPHAAALAPTLDLLTTLIDRFQRDPQNPPLAELAAFLTDYDAKRLELDRGA